MLEDEFIKLFKENSWSDIKKKEAYAFAEQTYSGMSVEDLRRERAKLVALERRSSLSHGEALTITPMFISVGAVAITILNKTDITLPVDSGNSIINIMNYFIVFLWIVFMALVVGGVIYSICERYKYAKNVHDMRIICKC